MYTLEVAFLLYIASLLASVVGPEEVRRPTATIALAWSFYELLKTAGHGLGCRRARPSCG